MSSLKFLSEQIYGVDFSAKGGSIPLPAKSLDLDRWQESEEPKVKPTAIKVNPRIGRDSYFFEY